MIRGTRWYTDVPPVIENISVFNSLYPKTAFQLVSFNFLFLLEVTPHLSMSLNGSRESTIFVEEGEKLYITCTAARGRPAANLLIFANGRRIPTGDMPLSLPGENETVDTQSSVSVTFDEYRANVTCISEGHYGVMEKSLSVLVNTYGEPNV